MAKPTVFIDGHAGTTGLVIHQALAAQSDVELLTLDESQRKSARARKALLNQVDLAVLCLPDDAAREAVTWITNPTTRVLDASSAHRTRNDWVYGLPEMCPTQREQIASAKRVANPGCYPNTPILGLRPLVEAGLIDAAAALTVIGLSGYSGGGKSLIERWESASESLSTLPYPAPYALGRVHKHLPEISRYALLEHPPTFLPRVGPFRRGMRVEISLHARHLAAGVVGEGIWQALSDYYASEPFVQVAPLAATDPDEHGLDPRAFNGTNTLELSVYPNAGGHVWLIGRLDNLGKGAGSAAIQNINIMLGLPEQNGLRQHHVHNSDTIVA